MTDGFAGDALFEREPGQEEILEWTELLSRTPGDMAGLKTTSVLIFRLGEERLALPTVNLQEVLDMGPVHRVPHRDSHVLKGLIQIRGGLELCVSLGALLGSQPARSPAYQVAGERCQTLLVGKEHKRFAFPVSEVLGIYKVSDPEICDLHDSDLVRSSFSWEGQLVGLLEIERLHDCLLEKIRR